MRGTSHLYTDRIAEMVEMGWRPPMIAARLNLSKGQVAYRPRAEGLDPYARRSLPPVPAQPIIIPRGPGGQLRKFSQAEDAQLLELEAQGLPIPAIARAMGRRPGSIRARLQCLARREERECA